MISVITPTKSAGAHIRRNLQVMAMQNASFEHIIQDAGSDDDVTRVVHQYSDTYPLRFYSEPDRGLYDGILKGIAKADGDVLAWLGADDHYLPWTLATVERIFAARPDINWIIGIPALGYSDGRIVKVNPLAPVYLRKLVAWGWYKPGCLGFLQQEAMFWRRSLWESAGAEAILRTYQFAADFQLWRAFARESKLVTVASVLGVFMERSQQISATQRDNYFAEAGCRASTIHASGIGKLFNRCLSVVMSGKILRPETCI
jgi:glycosyltransferase involved in cell wall biosynthesis